MATCFLRGRTEMADFLRTIRWRGHTSATNSVEDLLLQSQIDPFKLDLLRQLRRFATLL